MRFGETKLAKKEFHRAKKAIKIWDVIVDNIVTSKLLETKTNSKYFTGYLDEVIKILVLILHKMSQYVKNFKVKGGNKDKNYKLM